MAINSLSTGFRPGVCTSSTRPTAPYEGQVIYETDTDLSYVWGGAAWQQVSGGTAVGNSGLVYVKSQAIGSGVASVTVTDAFSATYDNYLIMVSGTFPNTSLNWFEFGFNTAATTGFYGNAYGIDYLGTVTNVNSNNQGRLLITKTNAATGSNGMTINVNSPFLTTRSSIFSTSSAGPGWMINGGENNASTSFSQFFIRVSGGTMTDGTITVYGYRK
jgi:hypothetical protein